MSNEFKFTDVYLSNNFNPCPCGYIYGPDEMEKLAEHFAKGHYGKEKE